ncbi:hypothetical protein RhiirA4_511775 [Rhizophagus irregularis]|uniref:Uncharacterized protein n=1 Tax=Rhizophagus irregularis TaxID=588596 RepID=A0A2I1GBE8_9GLOM|nr:hypothetical protein RhiirA4_511775 [Rhizophagus irregularis]
MGIGLGCKVFYIDGYAKQQVFQIIKDRVSREKDIVRRHTYICSHSNKALRSNSNSEQLIELLQEFTEVEKSDSEELNEINQEDGISDKLILTLWYQMSRNPKKDVIKDDCWELKDLSHLLKLVNLNHEINDIAKNGALSEKLKRTKYLTLVWNNWLGLGDIN